MTAHERIEAAIAALEKATPGEWTIRKRVDNSGDYPFPDYDILAVAEWGPQGVAEAHQNPFNAALIAAAPDLVDEVIRLRKWQSEAVGILKSDNLYLFKGSLSEKEYQINLDTMDRLIAEAQEDYVDRSR